jgi:CubicO group peptidase (beta-lactamase class C family)
MKIFSTNTIKVPHNIASVTRIADGEFSPELAGMTESQLNHIWHAVESLYRTGNYPMLSICLRRQGKIVLNRTIGHSHGNGPEDKASTPKIIATPDTPVCLFSASKSVTAMLVHLLSERGEIDLLDPISQYIPEYGVKGKRRATILHLLAHRGGLPHLEGDVTPELLFDKDEVVRRLCAAAPESPSGYRMAYHAVTAGYILGELVERVSGQTLKEFLQENIAKPMGMTCFNYGLAPEFRDKVAISTATGLHPSLGSNLYLQHVLGGDLDLAVNVTNDPRFMDTICPAGNLYTTTEEAGRFFEMLLNGGSYNGVKIFNPKTVLRATIESSRMSIDKTLLAPMRYSTGFMLGANPIGLFGPMTSHTFGHLGFSNIFCWADPQRDISVSILNSGKSVIGTHLPALANLLFQISNNCDKVATKDRRSVFGHDLGSFHVAH